MICLRCGYCCKNYLVQIVDDVDEANAVGIDDGNMFMHEGNGIPCKHLRGDKSGEYFCSVHEFPWYKETGCFAFTQVEHGNKNCRMGEYILSKEKIDAQRK